MRTELVHADDQDGLVDLESQRLGLDKVEGLAVDLDESFTGLYVSAQYTVSCACGRGSGGVPCSGRQLFNLLATISIIWRGGAEKSGAYQSRSSSCRSIARSGKPCWTTVGCVRCEGVGSSNRLSSTSKMPGCRCGKTRIQASASHFWVADGSSVSLHYVSNHR